MFPKCLGSTKGSWLTKAVPEHHWMFFHCHAMRAAWLILADNLLAQAPFKSTLQKIKCATLHANMVIIVLHALQKCKSSNRISFRRSNLPTLSRSDYCSRSQKGYFLESRHLNTERGVSNGALIVQWFSQINKNKFWFKRKQKLTFSLTYLVILTWFCHSQLSHLTAWIN